MTDQNEPVFEEINWEERINERIKMLYDPELAELDNYIDFITYKRIVSINDNVKRVEEILKLRKTDFITLKKGLSEVKRYERTGSIFMHDAVNYLTKELQIPKADAILIINKLISLNYISETGYGNIRI